MKNILVLIIQWLILMFSLLSTHKLKGSKNWSLVCLFKQYTRYLAGKLKKEALFYLSQPPSIRWFPELKRRVGSTGRSDWVPLPWETRPLLCGLPFACSAYLTNSDVNSESSRSKDEYVYVRMSGQKAPTGMVTKFSLFFFTFKANIKMHFWTTPYLPT